MQVPSTAEIINKALAGQPVQLPVGYEHLGSEEPRRKDIVPNHIAQHIGPLFGVPNPNGPLKGASWFCDFREITLTEIQKGIPEPLHKEQNMFAGKPPKAIAPATTNRFGPSTKEAVILTGVNRLLEPQTTLLNRAIASQEFSTLETTQKLQAYGAVVFGVYQAQPLLVHAGLYARNIQRASRRTVWPIADRLKEITFARHEIPSAADKKGEIQTFDLDLVDATAANVSEAIVWKPFFKHSSATIVAEGLVHAVRDFGNCEIIDDPVTETSRIQPLGDPLQMSMSFVESIQGYLAR